MKQSYDVIVVGAGPAGATLAYELAKRGIEVLLLEKEKCPRYKCCAGGVTSKAVKLLDFDVTEVAEDVIYEVSITFNLGSVYLGRHSQPLIYTVMRDVFDYFLVEKAQQFGAVLINSQKVTRIQVSTDWVEISAADNIFRSRFVVGADGVYSVVARGLGIERGIEYIAGIESELVVPEEELAKWKSRAQVDLGYIPGGYAWVFPKRDHLSIGVSCPLAKAKDLNQYLQNSLDSLGVGSYTLTRSSAHLIPTCTKGRHIFQDKALLLGDAAGFADPLTGEGIYNAIWSAQLAAPVIEDSLARGKIRLQDYQQIVEREIISELRIAHMLSRFFARFPRLTFEMLNQSDLVWKTICGLMCGELNYAVVEEKVGRFKSIFNRLFQA